MPDSSHSEHRNFPGTNTWLFPFRVALHDEPHLVEVGLSIERTLGYDTSRLMDHADPFAFIAPVDHDKFADLLSAPPRRKSTVTIRLEDNSGDLLPCMQSLRPIEGDDGEIVALEGIVYRGSPDWEFPYDWIVNAINEGILICRFDGDIVYVNERMAEMLGYSREQMTGRPLFEFMSEHWADRARRNLERRKQGVEEIFDHQFIHRNGHPVWTMVATKPIPTDIRGLRGSLVAIRDISRRKQAEDELERAHDELEERVQKQTAQLRESNEALQKEVRERRVAEQNAREASRAKSAFLANMSHEVRTPLNAIVGYTDLIRRQLAADRDRDEPSDSDQIAGDLTNIEQAATHLLDLINDILDLSKVESGRIDVDISPCHLEEVIAEAIQTMRPTIEDNNNQLIVDYDGPDTLRTDRTKLKQILINLLSNAGKFTEDGQVTVSVGSTDYQGERGIRLAVTDTGVGIEEDQLDELLEPFTQADPSRLSDREGTGLGLAIVRRFSRVLGGTLTAESQPGVGSTFAIVLPVDPRSDEPPTLEHD